MKKRLVRIGLALAAIAACTADTLPPKGQLMLAITTNLAPPKDFDRFELTIVDGDNELKYGPYEMGGSQPTKLPATLAIVAGSDPSRAVRIKLEASRAGKARISREAIVRVPQSRIATLPLPIDGLCVDTPACPPDATDEPQTCIAGRCETAKVDETKLPDYAPAAVFGGGTGNGDGQCFDTISCFAGGKEATVRREDCSIAKELGGSGVNVAVVRPFSTDGVCAPMACLVPLDRDPFTDPSTFFTGWREDGDRVRLPPGVCERSFPIMVSTSCPTKNAPTCGPWSAVGSDLGLNLPIPFDAAVFGEGGTAPPNVPASLTFVDGDVREGFVKGNVVIGRAPDEGGIMGYRLYWADPLKKLDPIATLPKTGANITYPFEGPMLAESSHLHVVSYSATGEIVPHLATGPIDNFVRQRTISLQGEDISIPSTLIDAKNQRLLIVGQDAVSARLLPSMLNCQLDGTGCVYRDLTKGQTTGIGAHTGAVIDETNDKLLVVADYGVDSGGSRPTLYRCNRDGTNCDGAKDLGAPNMGSFVRVPVVIDDANKKFLALFDYGNTGRIVRCDLDGNNCTFPSFGAGVVNQMDGDFSIDKVGNKLIVVRAGGPTAGPYLFKCDIDGNSCGVKEIAPGAAVAADAVNIALDEKNQKLIIVAFATNDATLQFYRCNLDGEGCITRALPNPGINYPIWPHVLVDAVHEKIFVFTWGSEHGVYQRCELDGTGCTAVSTSKSFGMLHPRAALYDGKFFVVGAKNGAGADFATFLAY